VIDYCWRAADVSASAFGPCVIYPKKRGKKRKKSRRSGGENTRAHIKLYVPDYAPHGEKIIVVRIPIPSKIC